MTEHISIPFFDITDKVVLITGASGGLGQAAARGLSGAGAKVMLTGRHEDMLATLAAEVTRTGGKTAYVAGQPDDTHDMQRIVTTTIEHFGGIDVLITAAGLNHVYPIVDFPLEEWEEVMDVNVKGTWLACKEVGRAMIERDRGAR